MKSFYSTSQLRSPGVVTMVNGKNKTLYMSTVKSIEEATKANLKKTLKGNLLLFSMSQIPLEVNCKIITVLIIALKFEHIF